MSAKIMFIFVSFFLSFFFMPRFVLFCFSKCDEQDITYENVFANANADKLIELFVILYNFQLRCSFWDWINEWEQQAPEEAVECDNGGGVLSGWNRWSLAFAHRGLSFARSETELGAREIVCGPNQSNTNDRVSARVLQSGNGKEQPKPLK